MHKTAFWTPSTDDIKNTHLLELMRFTGTSDFPSVHRWSIEHLEAYWDYTIKALDIVLRQPYSQILDVSAGLRNARWLSGAGINIVDSCLRAEPDFNAIITQRQNGRWETFSVRQLDALSSRVANGLLAMGLGSGDNIAIDMALTAESVAIYFGILKIGGVVVSIADSFPPQEITKRLEIADVKAVFTQWTLPRAGKTLPMYEKVCAALAPPTVVLYPETETRAALRSSDKLWDDFLSPDTCFTPMTCEPGATINVLFSSGTTGPPKAIPWDHTTALKVAADAYYHHDIHPGDVVCWPTNLGWMMGPWLLFASLINRATMAVYEGAPTERGFCEFVEEARITLLGLVPSIVKAWRMHKTAEGLDWQHLRRYSSTGEASEPQDYRWLMTLNQPEGMVKPVIEYCGGTEIGGAYIGNNLITPQQPSEFNGKILGNDFVVLNERRRPCVIGDVGEVFLIPPAMGLSVRLLNNDNDLIYYHGCPTWNGQVLRRHGDRLIVRGPHSYQSDGRADNTMNLGGIKVGSMEIERVLNTLPGVQETAAIGAPPPEGGPDRLIVFAVLADPSARDTLHEQMQRLIKQQINPLYHLHEVVVIDSLPRTASHKLMHKELREQFRRLLR